MNFMRKFYRLMKRALPHLILICAAALIVLLIVNYNNPFMNFLENTAAHVLMYALCFLSILLAVNTSYTDYKK